jgi:hypothetical protein
MSSPRGCLESLKVPAHLTCIPLAKRFGDTRARLESPSEAVWHASPARSHRWYGPLSESD